MAEYDANEMVTAWKNYLDSGGGWRKLTEDRKPTMSGCGPIYEMGNPLKRLNEDFAIANMGDFKIAEAHYHPALDIEIYAVLEGTGTVVHGGEEIPVKPGSVVVIEPDTAHYAISNGDLVMAVINTPPFQPDRYIPVKESNSKLKFDQAQYRRLAT